MTLKFDTPNLSGGSLIVNYKARPDLILNLGRTFTRIGSAMGGQVSQLSVPANAPPEFPRILISTEFSQLKFSLTRMEAVLAPAQFENTKTTLKTILKKLEDLKAHLLAVYEEGSLELDFVGVILPIKFSQPLLSSEIHSLLVQKLTRGSNSAELLPVNISWNFGFLSEGKEAFLNYGVSVYEVKEFTFPTNVAPQESITIDLNSFPSKEVGVEVKFDINNRPKIKKGPLDDEINSLFDLANREQKKIPNRIFNIDG